MRLFWAWMNAYRSKDYFARARGWSILDRAWKYLPRDGVCLDLGAGAGDLTALLLARGRSVFAVEDAAPSLVQLRARFSGAPGFRGGLPSMKSLDGEGVAAAFAIEVVEHLPAKWAAELWAELFQVLRPGGVCIITTPHDERLIENSTCCPNCRATFHTVQHVRSFTSSTLRTEFEAVGFLTLRCEPVYFSLLSGVHARLESIRRWVGRYPRPHLLYIGRRP
jgi:SAM-dependent methyltransferase